jgi:S1-C subfamily serine protease
VADSQLVSTNQAVTAVGYPNSNKTISHGRLIHAYWDGPAAKRFVFFGGNLLIDHGASGSPVLNDQGEVIGMVKGGPIRTPFAFFFSAACRYRVRQGR